MTLRRLELTEAGSTLDAHAEQVMAAVDATEATLRGARQLMAGHRPAPLSG